MLSSFRTLRLALLALLALSLMVGTAGCDERSPVAPPRDEEDAPRAAAVPPTASPAITDCALLRVERARGNRFKAVVAPSPDCPGLHLPRLRRSELRFELHSTPGTLRLWLSVQDGTTDTDDGGEVGLVLDLPTATTNRGGVTGPGGTAYIAATNADATTPAGHPAPGAPIWLYGAELDSVDAAPTGLLEGGETSRSRQVVLRIDPAIKSFTIPLRVHVEATLHRGLAAIHPTEPRVLAAAVHKEGSRILVFGDSAPEAMLFTAPDGRAVSVWLGADLKPERALFEDQLVLFANWTAASVDIAVIANDSIARVFEDVPLGLAATPMREPSLRGAQHLTLPGGVVTLQAALRIGGAAIHAVGCATSALAAVSTGGVAIPLAALACGSFLVTSTVVLAPSLGEHPIVHTSLEALQIADCFDPSEVECWLTILELGLDRMADREASLAPRSAQTERVLAALRAIQPGSTLELGTLGGTGSQATDLNELGQVVGWSRLPDGTTHAFLWSPGGGMRDLGTLGGANSTANAINERGEVVGTSETAPRTWRPFVWTPARGMQEVSGVRGLSAEATDINDQGVVVGTDDVGGISRAFLWTESDGVRYLPLPVPDGGTSAAAGINNAGEVVGWAASCFSCNSTAARWSASGQHASIHPPFFGYISSRALDINDHGQVVGYAHGNVSSPFLWPSPGGQQPACGLGGDGRAQGINRAGTMVGWGTTPLGEIRVYTLPVRCVLSADIGAVLAVPGGETGFAEKVSDAGYAVGWIRNGLGQDRAMRWRLP